MSRNSRASEEIGAAGLPERFDGARAFSTSIYFLLAGDNFSAFHRIKSDELWHFYAGDGLTIHVIAPNGDYEAIKPGKKLDAGETLQAVVPAGSWFASEPNGGGYALVGCTVAPGFDFADFELAERDALQQQFPEHRELIDETTETHQPIFITGKRGNAVLLSESDWNSISETLHLALDFRHARLHCRRHAGERGRSRQGTRLVVWELVYTKQAQKDAKRLASAGLKPKATKLLDLLKNNPFQNPPPHEKLIGDLSVACSRRINIRQRLVYQVYEKERVVKMIRLWTHYE